MAFMLTNPLGRVVLAILVVVVVAVAWFALQIDPIFAGKGKEVIITVHDGDSMTTVLGELHAKGVIASPFAFRLEDEVLGAPTLHGGTFQLRQGSSFGTVRHILNSPPNVVVINATPGLTLHEIALEVASLRGVRFADQFAKVATNDATPSPYGDGSSLEGLIGAGSRRDNAERVGAANGQRLRTRGEGRRSHTHDESRRIGRISAHHRCVHRRKRGLLPAVLS
jgi:cell division protein YceG involved in septum cleavage